MVAALVVVASLIAAPGPARAADRTALIVVATDYRHLQQPALDLSVFRRLAEALATQGFKVHETYNERGSFLRAKLARFANDARGADMAIAVVAGHHASNARVTFFLPVETETETASDIFLRGIPTRSFLASIALARQGLLARLSTFPALPDRLPGLVSYPRIEAATAPGVGLATSGAANSPPARLNEDAARAARAMTQLVATADWDLRQLAEAATGGDKLLLSGDLPPSDFDRQAEERLRRERESRMRKERERRDAEAAAKEQARIASARRAEAESRATRMKRRAEEEAHAREEAERRARETAQRLEHLETEFRALKNREGELARLATEAKTAEAAHRSAEEKARQAESQKAAAASALAETKRQAAAREAELEKQLASLQSRLEQALADDKPGSAGQSAKPPEPAQPASPPRAKTPAFQPGKYKLAFLQRMDALLRPDQRRKIQQRLKEKGFLAADAAPEFDAATRAAIRRYQLSLGTEPTGYLTPPQFLELIAE